LGVRCFVVAEPKTPKTQIALAMAAVLNDARKQRDMSMDELAKRSGVPYGTLRNILRASVDTKIPDLFKLADALSTAPLPGAGPKPVRIEAVELVRRAEERLAIAMSEADAHNDDLQSRRLQMEAEKMSAAEIADIAIAANAPDPERHTDEPSAP
jgi:transcriptional regulator with XRE-family HTH domain